MEDEQPVDKVDPEAVEAQFPKDSVKCGDNRFATFGDRRGLFPTTEHFPEQDENGYAESGLEAVGRDVESVGICLPAVVQAGVEGIDCH